MSGTVKFRTEKSGTKKFIFPLDCEVWDWKIQDLKVLDWKVQYWKVLDFPKIFPMWKLYSCSTQFFYHFGVGLKILGLKSSFFNWTVKSGTVKFRTEKSWTEKFIFPLDCKDWDWKVQDSKVLDWKVQYWKVLDWKVQYWKVLDWKVHFPKRL